MSSEGVDVTGKTWRRAGGDLRTDGRVVGWRQERQWGCWRGATARRGGAAGRAVEPRGMQVVWAAGQGRLLGALPVLAPSLPGRAVSEPPSRLGSWCTCVHVCAHVPACTRSPHLRSPCVDAHVPACTRGPHLRSPCVDAQLCAGGPGSCLPVPRARATRTRRSSSLPRGLSRRPWRTFGGWCGSSRSTSSSC